MGAPRCLGGVPSPVSAPSPKTRPPQTPPGGSHFPQPLLSPTSSLVGSGGQYWQETSLDLLGRLALRSYDSWSAVANRGANYPRPCCQQPARAAPGRAGSPWDRGMPRRQRCVSAGEERNAFLGHERQPLQREGGIFEHRILPSATPRVLSPSLPSRCRFPLGAGGRRWCGCPWACPVPRARPRHGPRSPPPARWENASAGLFCICN